MKLIILGLLSCAALFGRARASGYCELSYLQCTVTVYYTEGGNGIVSTSGNTVTLISGKPFGGWASLTIAINSVNYVVSYVVDPSHLVLTTTIGFNASVPYQTAVPAPAPIYSNNLGTPLANPFMANTYGDWGFYADNWLYDVKISGAGFVPFTYLAISVFDPSLFALSPPVLLSGNITNPILTVTQLNASSSGIVVNGTSLGESISTSANGTSLSLSMGGTLGHALNAGQNTSGGTATAVISNGGTDPALSLIGGETIYGPLTVTGPMVVTGGCTGCSTPVLGSPITLLNPSSFSGVFIDGPSGFSRFVTMRTTPGAGACPAGPNSCSRWSLEANISVESGSNAGSNLAINRYNDTGAVIDIPFILNRATGNLIINSLTSNGQVSATTTSGTAGIFTSSTGTALSTQSLSGGLALQVQGTSTMVDSSSSPILAVTQTGASGYAATFNSITSGIFVGTSGNSNAIVLTMGGTAGHAISASQTTSAGTATALISNAGSDNALAVTGNTLVTGNLTVTGTCTGCGSGTITPPATITGSSSSALLTTTQSGTGYAAIFNSVGPGVNISTSSNGTAFVVSMGGSTGHAMSLGQTTSVGTATALISNGGSDNALTVTGNTTVTGNLTVTGTCTGCGGGVAPGANTNVIFNNAGAFGASGSLAFNGSTLTSPFVTAQGMTVTTSGIAVTGASSFATGIGVTGGSIVNSGSGNIAVTGSGTFFAGSSPGVTSATCSAWTKGICTAP